MRKKKKVLMLLMMLFIIPSFAFSAPAVISWGLVPNTMEKTPEPPKGGAELLQKNDGMFTGDTAKRSVYFTFDLGYEAGYTAEVLDILKEHSIQAVFFLCGNYLSEKDLVQRMMDEGHAIGNHTDKHLDLPNASDEKIQKDINDFAVKFKAQYGDFPLRYFRPPQGRFCERTLKTAKEHNLKTMLWSIAIKDWERSPIDAKKNTDLIASRLHPGAIILLHIANSGTPKMLKMLISKIIEKGYAIDRASEL